MRLSAGLYLFCNAHCLTNTENRIQTKTGAIGKITAYFVSLPPETPGPYKQGYHYSTIRVREGSRDLSEMTDENVGLQEKKKNRGEKRQWVSGRVEGWSRWTPIHLVGADGYMSRGPGPAVSRLDG